MMNINPLMRRFFYLCATVCFSSVLQASTIDDGDDIDQKDINALREWINTKRQVTVRELGGALSIAGEVRTEYQGTVETVNGVNQRGREGFRPSDAFDIEVNLMFDYRTERSWASVKLEFDNDAGVFSGTLNKLKLERAYWGVRMVDADTYTMDFEAGRRRMSSIVDSKIEFNTFFDGLWYKYDQSIDSVGDYYLHLGVFIINDGKDQFGYLGETGIFNIGGSGMYAKYSLTDWDTKHFHKKVNQHRFDFIVSQLLLGYRFVPKTFGKVVQVYAAALYNHAAKSIKLTNHTKQNWGGYAGFSIGELKKQWDWALDVNYQVLEAQCVPDFDVQGIGLGNAADVGFYTVDTNGTGAANTRENARGNVNYRGFQLTLDWLLTNQLDLQQSWQQSITLDNNIGPHRRFKQYEIEFIYGF
ncbi:MAG: hypothetical protein JSR39_09885 [Verrucomicrobia bacterium]|nr:hypothetical protein [Verrucomicrobiota bacterium]